MHKLVLPCGRPSVRRVCACVHLDVCVCVLLKLRGRRNVLVLNTGWACHAWFAGCPIIKLASGITVRALVFVGEIYRYAASLCM